MIDTRKYIQIPFKEHGRNFSGCDCYGLVKLFYQEEFNIDLPDFSAYDDTEQREKIEKLIDFGKPLLKAKPIDKPKIGCLVLFKSRGFVSHIGLYIGKNMVLHITKKTNCLCERLNSKRLKGRVDGFYELKYN